MKFIIGIGNPEPKYEKTRHNAGFRVLDSLKEQLSQKGPAVRWQADRACHGWTCQAQEGTWLIKPATYVNLTGQCVKALERKFSGKFFLKDVLFVCDDVNLDFGTIRIRASGSAGGHHGLESVIEAFGSEDFARLRIGIRTTSMPRDLAGFVLEKFSLAEEHKLQTLLSHAAVACQAWAEKGYKQAVDNLSKLNSVI